MTPDKQPSETHKRLKDICDRIHERIPEGAGFIVMVFPTEANKEAFNGRINYSSNIDRKCAVNVLKEWLIRAGGGEEWMKHLD